tara:strand:+ start:12743 stop:13405 length:663 start_codon:yes stop_codon:yes gene_type:complete
MIKNINKVISIENKNNNLSEKIYELEKKFNLLDPIHFSIRERKHFFKIFMNVFLSFIFVIFTSFLIYHFFNFEFAKSIFIIFSFFFVILTAFGIFNFVDDFFENKKDLNTLKKIDIYDISIENIEKHLESQKSEIDLIKKEKEKNIDKIKDIKRKIKKEDVLNFIDSDCVNEHNISFIERFTQELEDRAETDYDMRKNAIKNKIQKIESIENDISFITNE